MNVAVYNIDSCDIAVAGYSGGRMVTVQNVIYSGENAEVILNGDFDEIKVMALEDMVSMRPFCEAMVMPKTDWLIE